jgi:hypothetical protein
VLRVLLSVLVLAACTRSSFSPPRDSVLLPIPDRQWAKGAPPEGWCGEVSVQMVALYYGAWLPQVVVNRVAHPKHVDVWEDELPATLTSLGLRFEPWTGRDEGALLSWTVDSLRAGQPVILGVKLLPTEHPDWQVDHLMPAVGFSPTKLVFNTNLGS